MKLYRLYNLSELGPACGLHFLKREGAEGFKDLIRWPYINDSRWPLVNGGTLPLDQVDLRVEVLDKPVAVESFLESVVWEQQGQLGGAPLLLGDCFDPDEWQPYPKADFDNPVLGPRLDQAWQRLKDIRP